MVMATQNGPGQRIPSIPEIVAALDRVIVGHDAAKRALAMAAFRHYLGVRQQEENKDAPLEKQHVLLAGPSGTGKTRMLRELGRVLGQDMIVTSATSLVEVGYVGEQVESIVRALYANSNGNLERVQRGIVFVDEIDKTRRSSESIRDVSGAGVQNALLKLLDGVDVAIKERGETTWVSTDRIFFVFAGAFDGMDDIVRSRRAGRIDIGFAPPGPEEPATSPSLEAEDFIRFGLVREFVGRMGTLARLSALEVQDLERILVEPTDSWLRRTRAFYASLGVELNVSDAAIKFLAREAQKMGTGARALDLVASRHLEPTLWRLLGTDASVSRIDVTCDTVERGEQARFYIASKDPAAPGQTVRSGFYLGSAGSDAASQDGAAKRWTAEWYGRELLQLERMLHLDDAQLTARTWWHELVRRNRKSLGLVHHLAEQLLERKATIDELYNAYLRANVESFTGVLHYLDYLRVVHDESRNRREQK